MMKRNIALILSSVMVLSLAACNAETVATSETTPATVVETSQAAEPADAGFTEIPIFEDEEVGGLLNLSAVYFQPVPMKGGTQNISAEDFDIHLEADISALENNLGYGLGDWIPYLTVDYDVIGSDGNSAAAGTFMVMSASDGPHYGANIKLPNADTYSLKITIHDPGENGYLIHADSETGPGGLLEDYFGNGPLSYTFEGWDYTPQEW